LTWLLKNKILGNKIFNLNKVIAYIWLENKINIIVEFLKSN
jgi:hypothetical protein